MAKNKVDACIFCDKNPCECHGPAKKAAKKNGSPPRKKSASTKPQAPVAEVPQAAPVKLDPLAAMRAAAHQARDTLRDSPGPGDDSRVPSEPPRPEPDAELRAALPALRSILHPDELARYADILEPQSRAAAWKTRISGKEA